MKLWQGTATDTNGDYTKLLVAKTEKEALKILEQSFDFYYDYIKVKEVSVVDGHMILLHKLDTKVDTDISSDDVEIFKNIKEWIGVSLKRYRDGLKEKNE